MQSELEKRIKYYFSRLKNNSKKVLLGIALVGALAGMAKAEEILIDGRKYIIQGEGDNKIVTGEENGKNVAYELLGNQLYGKGKLTKKEKGSTIIYGDISKDSEILIDGRKSLIYGNRYKNDETESPKIEKKIKEEPTEEDLYLQSHHNAIATYERGDYEQAIPEFKKAMHLKIPSKEDFYKIAECYAKVGSLDEAISILEIGTDIYKKDAGIYRRLGCYTEDSEESIEQYKKALEINPKDAKALVSIGYNLWLLKKKEESLEFYRKAANLGHEGAIEWVLKQSKK